MDFAELLLCDELELYRRYGQETGAGAAEPDPEAGGRIRFNVLLANVRSKLCAEPRIRAFITEGSVSDQAALSAVVLEILVSYLGGQMPALPTAAVLIVKIGLGAICGRPAQ